MLKALEVIDIFKNKMCWYIYNKTLADSTEKGTNFVMSPLFSLPSPHLLPQLSFAPSSSPLSPPLLFFFPLLSGLENHRDFPLPVFH